MCARLKGEVLFYSLWSSKGGSGTSTVAAAVALSLAGRGGVRLADLCGDQPAIFGLERDPDLGLLDWLAAGVEAPTEAFEQFAVAATHGISILPAGGRSITPSPLSLMDQEMTAAAGAALVVALRDGGTPVIADVGVPAGQAARAVVESADASIVVVRGCYLALRRAVRDPLTRHAAGIVLLEEPGRALGEREVGETLGRPVIARLGCKASIARSLDAGTFTQRPPACLVRLGEGVLNGFDLAGSLRGRVA